MLKKALLATVLVGLSPVVLAAPLSGLTVKVGASVLNPTGDSDLVGLNLKATNEVNFTPSIDYRFANTPFSVELLLALPFEQEVRGGGMEIASLKHLPPTITAKYNLPTLAGFTPYVGVGATVFVPWDEELSGAAKAALGLPVATKLEADITVGAAAQLGFNFKPADAKNWGVFADVRYADLKTDLKVAGGDIGSLKINPVVATLGYSYNF